MKCTIFLLVVAIAAAVAAESEPKPDVESSHSIMRRDSGCDSFGCNQFCVRLGHARGVCIGSYCQCRSRKRRSLPQAEFQNIESPFLKKLSIPEAELQISERKHIEGRARCDPYECDSSCRKMGYKRGVCVGYCQCRTV